MTAALRNSDMHRKSAEEHQVELAAGGGEELGKRPCGRARPWCRSRARHTRDAARAQHARTTPAAAAAGSRDLALCRVGRLPAVLVGLIVDHTERHQRCQRAGRHGYQPVKRLSKKVRRGFRGYPVATIAFYGPDAGRASKVAVGIVMTEGEEVADLRRWTSVDRDVRRDAAIAASILEFIAKFEVRTVVMTDRIIGCPHEEGIDYEGSVCPRCEFWANRDRWIGEVIH